jgi:hypothetical protein
MRISCKKTDLECICGGKIMEEVKEGRTASKSEWIYYCTVCGLLYNSGIILIRLHK